VFKHLAIVFWAAAAVLYGSSLCAQDNSALGLWKNVEPTRTIMIRTTEQNGELTGKVRPVGDTRLRRQRDHHARRRHRC